jgi:YbbR domain-containing protein
MVSEQIKKQLPVRGSFEGQTADGFTAEVPVFEPSIITAFGPEAYLKNVDHAWVTFGANEEVSQTYSVETGFSLQNKDGDELSTTGLNFSTDVITATLPILSVKEVPLAVNLIDGGGATADNVIVSFDPVSSITLVGDSTLLAGKNKIIVATIDLSSFENSFSDTYTIPLDDGVRNQTGVNEVKVTVEVVGLASRTFTVTEMSCINVTSGYDVSIISESINVKLRGSADSISRVQSQNIRAVADLTDYVSSTGTFMPEVKIYVDGFSDVAAG